MPDSSTQTTQTQTPTYLGNYADCGAMINQAKIASYMWYIHVTVRVNAADRLRHSLAYILGQETTTATPFSPSYSAPFGFTHINIAGSGNAGSRTLVNEGDVASADRIDDLVDYFVLGHFYQGMLEILVNTAPIEEYARGYEQALAAIPAHFREEFCRRLYGLLFSKYIVEWPQGIAVPEPAPGSIAAAAAAATSTGSETVAVSTSSDTDVSEHRCSPIQTPREEEDDKDDGYKSCMDRIISNMDVLLSDDEAEEDYFTCNNSVVGGEKYKYPVNTEPPESPGDQSTLGPATPWPDTPSPGYNPELAKAAYFGTVSEPLPIQYRGIWGRERSNSSRDDGTARGACEKAKTGGEGTGEYACAAADASSAAIEDASHDDPRLPSASNSPRHQQHQHQQHHQQHQQHHSNPQTPRPPHDATPQGRPASQLGCSAHSRVSHTGSRCCSCRARQAWSHGVGAQR